MVPLLLPLCSNDTQCEEHPLGDFHGPFGWIEEARYEGEHTTHSGVKVEVWAARVGPGSDTEYWIIFKFNGGNDVYSTAASSDY